MSSIEDGPLEALVPQPPHRLQPDWQELDREVLVMVRSLMRPDLRRFMDSGDVKQEVLSEVLRSQSQFDPERGASFYAWVRGIVLNRLRNLSDFHHAQRRDPRRSQPIDTALEPQDETPFPVDQAAFDEERDRLLVALEGLSPTDRLLIIGRSFDRLSFSELAQQLGKPSPDAARVGFARAMSRLALFFERR